jgi:hypothetical protein
MHFGGGRICAQADGVLRRLASGFGPAAAQPPIDQECVEQSLSIGCQVAAWDPRQCAGGKKSLEVLLAVQRNVDGIALVPRFRDPDLRIGQVGVYTRL